MSGVNQKIQLVDLAYDPKRIDEVRLLLQEYSSSLGVDLFFQNFDQEMATLPGDYSPPTGLCFWPKIRVKRLDV